MSLESMHITGRTMELHSVKRCEPSSFRSSGMTSLKLAFQFPKSNRSSKGNWKA